MNPVKCLNFQKKHLKINHLLSCQVYNQKQHFTKETCKSLKFSNVYEQLKKSTKDLKITSRLAITSMNVCLTFQVSIMNIYKI